MPTIFDVAAYILFREGDISTMKMQKLLYYVQAWNLVWKDKPLFNEDFEAWANGPVCREYFDAHRGSYSVNAEPYGNHKNISRSDKETINSVLSFYGKKDPAWLSNKTHEESPWLDAREGLTDGEYGRSLISKASMRDYYASL